MKYEIQELVLNFLVEIVEIVVEVVGVVGFVVVVGVVGARKYLIVKNYVEVGNVV